ncbi:hypothetical protein [Bradyrhizobium sp. WSM1743]|uniref:hypothetical protein n=1 Tax=Bradyrhizobium sp. WSM1743 TaxID=318996 RepID=UPI0012EB452F|nr:hypothetical protein [Bradyrhizobium sp. WSM1743]
MLEQRNAAGATAFLRYRVVLRRLRGDAEDLLSVIWLKEFLMLSFNAFVENF